MTLAARLRDAGEHPEAGCWQTKQIVSVLFGNLHAQKLRKTTEEADSVALKNAILRGEFLNRLDLENIFERVAERIKEVIKRSALSAEDKDDLFRAISGIKVGIGDLAARGRRAKNGSGDHPKAARKKAVKQKAE